MNRSDFIGRYAVVRCRDAGVHIGRVESIDGREVVLDDARRLWRWKGAFSLSDLALGASLDPEFTLLAPPISVLLSEFCEIIPITAEVQAAIYALPHWTKATG